MEELFSQSSDELIDNNTNPPEGLPDGVYNYPGVDALYKKENGQWYKKIGQANYIPLQSGNVEERIKTLELKATPYIPKKQKEIPTEYDLANQGVTDYSKYKNINDEWYSGNGEIFTDYPGKEGKAYRFENGKWYEYSSTISGSNGDISQLNDPIKDPLRINALNKYYKKQGGPEKDVLVGYPRKEENQYKVQNGKWLRKTPESDTWVTITDEGSIKSLNNHFKKNISLLSDESEISKLKTDNEYSLNFNKNLKNINANFIGKEEEEAVKKLRQWFPVNNGWKFDETGVGDRIKITAPNGQEETFILDNWSFEDDKFNANSMLGWMQSNNLTPSEREIFNKYDKLTSEPDQKIKITAGGAFDITPMNITPDYIQKKAREEWLPLKSQKIKDIYDQYSEYISSGKEGSANLSKSEIQKAQSALGALANDKETILQVDKYQDDIKQNIKLYKEKINQSELYLSTLNEKYKNGEIDYDQYKSEYSSTESSLINQKNEINNQIKVSDNLVNSVNKSIGENYLAQELKGSFGGAITLSAIKGFFSPVRLLLGAVGEDMSAEKYHEFIKEVVSPIWDYQTSLQYLRSQENPDLYQAAFSVAESLGAMAPLALSGGTTLLGEGLLARGAMGAVSFYPMTYYEMKDELENIDIPESDKVALSSIYGIVSSTFESIGMEYAMGRINTKLGSSIKRSILKNVLSKTLPKDASKEYIEALVRTETKAYVASLGLDLATASGVEGLTEGIQSSAGAGIKELYDIGKGTKFFNNKGFEGVVKNSLHDGYLGALGGGMVHSVYIASDAISRSARLNNNTTKLLMMAAKTNGISEAVMTNLKSDLLNGRITKDEAKEIVNNFNIVRGNLNQMPENLTDEAKSVSLSLMLERDRLNKEIEGKDPNLVKPQSDRITEINNNLQELSKQNAVQEPSTEGVLQREPEGVTETGGERGGVETIVQGEETTEKSSQEKVNISEGEAKNSESISKFQKTPVSDKKADIEKRNKETEAKIKNKDLFLASFDKNGNKTGGSVGDKISQSNVAPVATTVREVNDIEFVEFSNPETGDVDVVITGKKDGSYVGYYRLYDKSIVNGEVVYTPTNKWSSKLENTGSKEDFKTMISGAQEMLPKDHEWTEKTSISTDGLRVWGQQLGRGYELQYDENGKIITDEVAINGDAIVNQLGIPEERLKRGKFANINVTGQAEFDKVKEALLPYLKKFGLNESNIKWEVKGPVKTGTVKIDLPVLKPSATQSSSNTKTSEEVTPVKQEVVPGDTAKIADVDIVYPTEPQAEERKAFRSTSEYVENASKELPVEDVETFTKELDGDFGLLTAENPMAQPLTEEENKQLNQKAEEWLTGRGYKPRRVTGKYGQAENSFFVPNLTRQDAIDFAKQFNQEAVAHSDGLVYQDGSMNPRVKADDNLSFTESYSPDSDFVSVVNTKDGLKTFSIGYNFDQKVMPEQQAATQISEVTITPETNQTVTERINKETDTKRKKVFTAVQKVLSAIPNSRIILHDNVDAFVAGVAKSAGITKEKAIEKGINENRGSYVNGDIHINLETAGVTTVFHEAFHDLLAKKGMDNNALLDMAKGLKSVISDKALKTRLDKFVSNYEQGERAEEYTTELGAIMAEAQKELSTTKFQQFKTLVNKIAKKLGMPVVFSAASTAQDAVDFMNSMAGKLGKGEQIEVGEAIKVDTNELSIKAEKIGDFDVSYFEDADDYKKLVENGSVENNYDINKIAGEVVAIHQPDNMFVGDLNYKGKNIFKGLGGVFYTLITGNVWASGSETSAKSLANLINKSLKESTDGIGRLVLVRGTDSKMISSTEGVKAAMSVIELLVDKGLISRSEFRSSLIRAGKKFNIDFSGKDSSAAIHNDIKEKFMDVKNSTFQKRGDFFDEVINDLSKTSKSASENIDAIRKELGSKRKISFSKDGIRDSIGDILTERLLKDLPTSHVYAVIEVTEPVTYEERKGHDSYPWVLKSKSKPKLKLLSDRGHAVKDGVFEMIDGSEVSQAKLGLAQRGMGTAKISQQPSNAKKIKAQKQSKDDAIQDAKDKYELSVEKRGKDHKTGVTAAIADLQKSDWYRDADDTQREESIREIKKFFGEKLKAAPSIAKVTGKTKQTAFVSDLAAAIRDQVKLQARSSRETAKNINDRRKALGVAIKDVVKQYKGKITERQLNAINRKIANVNLFNQEMVERVIDYVNKVMNNAEYATKVNNAFAERRAIRRMMKSGNMAETVAVAKEFTQIDPSMVDDIDAYLEMAEKIRGAVKKSKRVKDSASLKQIVNFGEAYEYIKPVLDAQEESMKNMLLAEYNDLAEAGVISKDMTLKDINNIIKNIRAAKDEEVTAEQEKTAREFLKQRLESIKLIISMVANGYNPLTGEVMEISDRNKQMIAKVVKSDMNNMSTKQLIEMVDSLSNFVENGAVGGIEAAYSTYVGEENAASLEREGVVARPLKMYFNKKLGQIFGTELTSLKELFNRMFVGAKKGMEIMTKSGFADVILGANKARRQVKEIQDRYVQRFGKNKNFFQIENVYERGVFAFLSRNIIGSESEVKAEFNRRVDMLLESVEALKNGTAKEQEMAKVYEKVLDKLDVKSRDLFSIERKMSLSNWDATQWWINEWSSHYSDLSDVSRSVYNTILGKDINYTPDRYKSTTEGSSQGIDNNLVERNSAFLINTDAITDTNESGVMIASVRPKVLPKGRYVSLDFDVNNIDSLTGALVDINTAGAIRQVDSFFKSKSFKSIVPSVEDRRILTERVNRYIRRSKNKLSVPSDVFRNIDNALNTVSSVGTALGLGGVLQSVKQTVSVAISTAIQTGTSFKIYAGQDFNNWLNTTGASVANRGQESLTAIESANKKIQSFNGTFDKAIDTYKNLTQWQLRLFLSRPDVFVARAAFKSYYEQFLKSKGYDVSEINWATWDETIKKYGIEELNKEAVVYADIMVSRQQNVSDERLAGELLASEDSARKLIRKALLPFASFSINQRARLVADINALFLNWNNISPEDKAIAIKSIAGTTAEQGVFQLINFGIGMALYSVAQSITGHDDDDEDWNKRMRNATKYPIKSLLADMTSPNPLADDAVVFGADQLLSMFGSPSESEIKQAIKDEEESRKLLGKKPMTEAQINEFKEQYKKDNTYQLAYNFSNAEEGKYGMFSIAYDQYVKLAKNSEMADKGTFTDDYMGKETTKYLTDKDKSIAKSVFYGLEVPYTTGAGVKEMGQVANKTYSILRKRALTESQYEVYKEFKKEFKREPQEWEIKMIKTNKNTGKILGAINYVQDNGGLSNKQGIEYLNVFKKTGSIPTIYTFRMIEQGKSSKYILNKMLENRNKSNNDEVIFD